MINTKQYYQKLIPFYCKKFKLSNVTIKKDNRIKCSAFVGYNKKFGKKIFTIVCNIKKLDSNRDYNWSLITMFHELGHIKYDLSYNNKRQRILSEYKAEKFALKQMKKYYPKRYKKLIKYITKKVLPYYKENYPLHYKAYLKIKEYKMR